MEALQNYLPSRVPSNVDFGLNVGGTLIGAVLAGGAGTGRRHRPLEPVSRPLVRRGGARRLVLLALWPFALLFPAAVPLGLGQVLERSRRRSPNGWPTRPSWNGCRCAKWSCSRWCRRRAAVRALGALHALPAGLHGPALHRPSRAVFAGMLVALGTAPRRCRPR
jgi:hypothetical protein